MQRKSDININLSIVPAFELCYSMVYKWAYD